MPLPPWALARLKQDLPLVVRRGPRLPGTVPVGLRGDTRAQRMALQVEARGVGRVMRPEDLCAVIVQDPLRAELPAFRALALLHGRVAPGWVWGPTGSVGFELASGCPAVNGDSDLDIVLRAPLAISPATAREWAKAFAGLPCRCDVQLDTGPGGVALAEWAGDRRQVLLKTDAGPRLVPDPWNPGLEREP
jgi:phosphoribosyl-dephospho-CoA transferase